MINDVFDDIFGIDCVNFFSFDDFEIVVVVVVVVVGIGEGGVDISVDVSVVGE